MIGKATPYEAVKRAKRKSTRDRKVSFSGGRGPRISLVGHRVGLDSLDHTMFMATSGAGKNLVFGPTFKSLVEVVMADPTRRFMVIETRGQFTQALEGMGAHYHLITLSGRKGFSPDFARDFDTYGRKIQLGFNLLTEVDGNNAFFRNGARGLLVAGTVSIDHVTEGNWGIDDLVNFATADPDVIKAILARSSLGQRFLSTLACAEDENTFFKLRTELVTWTDRLMTAAAKYQVSDSLSVVDFWAGKTEAPILVIKLNPEQLEAERAAVSALLQRSFEYIMALTPPVDPGELRKDKLIVIDDFNFYRVPGFLRASEMVRGTGGLLIALSQSIEGLRSKASYGDEADGLLANFPNIVMLRSASPVTAKWFSSLFGQGQKVMKSWGTSFGKEGVQGRADERRSIEHLVLDREFLTMTPPSPENGVTCYLKTQAFGEELAKVIPWEQIIERTPPTAPVDFSLLPQNLQEPAHWSDEQREFLCSGVSLGEESQVNYPNPFGESLNEFEEELRRTVFDLGFEAIELLVDPEAGR